MLLVMYRVWPKKDRNKFIFFASNSGPWDKATFFLHFQFLGKIPLEDQEKEIKRILEGTIHHLLLCILEMKMPELEKVSLTHSDPVHLWLEITHQQFSYTGVESGNLQ